MSPHTDFFVYSYYWSQVCNSFFVLENRFVQLFTNKLINFLAFMFHSHTEQNRKQNNNEVLHAVNQKAVFNEHREFIALRLSQYYINR